MIEIKVHIQKELNVYDLETLKKAIIDNKITEKRTIHNTIESVVIIAEQGD